MGPFSNDLLPKHGIYFFNSRNLKFDRSDNALQKIKFETAFYPGYLRVWYSVLNQNMFRNYYGHNLIRLQNGELLMICGTDIDAGFADTSNVWRHSDNALSLNGNMIQVRFLIVSCFFLLKTQLFQPVNHGP